MQLPAVVVMQPVQHRARDEVSSPLWLGPSHWLARPTLPNTLAGSRLIEVFLVLLHHARKVSLAQVQKVAEALSMHAAQKSFTDRVQP